MNTPTPRADVRLERVVMPERQEPHRRGERHDAQLQVLLDFGAVGVHEVDVRPTGRLAVVADAEAGVELVAEPDQLFAADRRAAEIAKVKSRKSLFSTARRSRIVR